DRQVDAAGDDDQRHAERDDRDERGVARDVVEVLLRVERFGRERQEDAGKEHGDQDPEGLAGGDRRQPAVLLLCDRLVERGGHGQTCSMAPVMRPVTSSGELWAIFLSAILRPRRMTMTRSATAKTSGMRWLMCTMARSWSRRCFMRFKSSATWRTEIAAVGSSINTILAFDS